jgi:hypothetical protein
VFYGEQSLKFSEEIQVCLPQTQSVLPIAIYHGNSLAGGRASSITTCIEAKRKQKVKISNCD